MCKLASVEKNNFSYYMYYLAVKVTLWFLYFAIKMPVDSYDITTNVEEQLSATNRPEITKFRQQTLPSWQPVLTPISVLPTFIIVAVVFIPLGIGFLIASNNVIEVSMDYTQCDSLESNGTKCYELRINGSLMKENCTCMLNITVPEKMTGTINVYYGLSEFYQNHRRYVSSRNDLQLNGEHFSVDNITKLECGSYTMLKVANGTDRVIAPCGAIANSLFNDTFMLMSSTNSVFIEKTGIAWETDHSVKFQNPSPKDDLTSAFSTYAQPKFWTRSVIELDPENDDNNGYKNEDLEVWMRTSAFSTFRKLYGKIFSPLEPGNYSVEVVYNFPVTTYHGKKRFILSTSSFIGGKNNFLGVAYITVGGFSLFMVMILVIVQFITKTCKHA